MLGFYTTAWNSFWLAPIHCASYTSTPALNGLSLFSRRVSVASYSSNMQTPSRSKSAPVRSSGQISQDAHTSLTRNAYLRDARKHMGFRRRFSDIFWYDIRSESRADRKRSVKRKFIASFTLDMIEWGIQYLCPVNKTEWGISCINQYNPFKSAPVHFTPAI